MENLGFSRPEMERRAAETAAFFGMEDWLHQKTEHLSGGQKQLLHVASAMVLRPKVLLLDEPASQLDPKAAQSFLGLLRRIRQELGVTILLCDHTPGPYFFECDHFLLLSKGSPVFYGTPQETASFFQASSSPLRRLLPPGAQAHAACAEGSSSPRTLGEGRRWLQNHLLTHPAAPVLPRTPPAVSQTPPAIRLRQGSFRYERHLPDILKDVDFSASFGSITAIMGSNGSGKTTFLQVLMGALPLSGGTLLVGTTRLKPGQRPPVRMAYLPQDPQTLFSRDSLREEWEEMGGSEEDIRQVTEFCGLTELSEHHPYDLSGGEQQKAALAKLLLIHPDILLLDEPVKGLDVSAREEIARLLKALAAGGLCVVLVSHDLDFCAAVADRCGLFFGGRLHGLSDTHAFFEENALYTTEARRLSVGLLPGTITTEEILRSLGVSDPSPSPEDPRFTGWNRREPSEQPRQKKKPTSLFGPFCMLLLCLSALPAIGVVRAEGLLGEVLRFAGWVLMAVSAGGLFRSGMAHSPACPVTPLPRPRKAVWASLLLMTIAIPLTIFVGVVCLGDSRYLFISLLIMLECSVPFFWLFEKKQLRTREYVLIAALCALCVASRAALFMFPECKPITALVILSGVALGPETGFLVGTLSMFASNMLFSQGPWTPWQMFAMGLIGFLAGAVFRFPRVPKHPCLLAPFGFLAAVAVYGGIRDPAALILSHAPLDWQNVAAYYAVGFPVNVVHGLFTGVFLYVASGPFLRKLERIKKKYGLIEPA